jgi:FtsP/CotA-like multicopper oxidase with cupredoxin domain
MPLRPHFLYCFLVVSIAASCLVQESHAAAAAAAVPVTSTRTPGVSGKSTDYISCDDPCNGGDVNYELVASVRTMQFLNYTYRGRTYSNASSPTFMGPTLRVKPGQSMWIKLVNNLTDPTLGPAAVTPTDYWKMLQTPGEKIKYQFYKKPVADPSLLTVDEVNLPKHFDNTNLHLHGLDVQVHMFDPVGTHNPDAPHVAVHPGECYCYQFHVPEHHPVGMYWYHPHLHGATAVQMWGGMMGLLYVENGGFEKELAAYNVKRSEEFVIFDPAFRAVDKLPSHNLEVDEFLMGQTTLSKIHPFLVNGQLTPNFDNVRVNQVLHLRALCGTVENENTFIIYPQGSHDRHWEDAAISFYVIGSDGVFASTPKERKILVMAGGQREEILVSFDKPGTYVVSQQGISGMQFFDMYGHPKDQILATITVVNGDGDGDGDGDANNVAAPTVPISEMRFTPGYSPEETIQSHEIVQTETIVFSMGANRDQVPFPQYYVNGLAFAPDRLDFFAHPGEAREYILINANHNVHPFHIHVNRFQVKEMGSELSVDKYPVLGPLLDFDPDAWRDTVVVPPNGRTRIWVQYKNYTGKTLFHCHFLAHEDTGMMSTLFIGMPDQVFRWKDHSQLLMGVAIGVGVILLAMLIGAIWSSTRSGSGSSSSGSGSGRKVVLPNGYAAVTTMNELKAKALD